MDSSSSSPIWKHHVFPSFRGEDVRKTLYSHILQSFKRKGIDLFLDENIPRDMPISQSLIEGMTGSEMAIVILSRNYASSSWCLDELTEIMKCKEELGQIVLPVFYEVHPSDVKKQSGGFGENFRKTCELQTEERIGRWTKALQDVATIPGEHSDNWTNDADMIEKIAADVSNALKRYTPSIAIDSDKVVGMRDHMEMMQKLLRLDLNEVRMIGIWGPSGIGKTTIAKDLYNQISHRFQLATFIMVDTKRSYSRPCLDEYYAQLQLRKQMISKLGVEKEGLKDKKVFLILDDADLVHLNALMKEIQGFGYGSRIIVVTENLSLLKKNMINHYKVNYPSWEEAFQILCMHAFGDKQPDDGFEEIYWKVAGSSTPSTPLELKKLGSVLLGKTRQDWEIILPRLMTNRNEIVEADARRERTVTKSLMDVKVKPPQFQVFINFRGDELRSSFVSYLVDALERSEINVFADYQEQSGEDFDVFFKRIEESRIAIVVFSKRYTESEFCLNELAMIKERAQKGLLKVLPIFFKVTPINVERLKGDFGDHFRDKEYEYRYDQPLINRWKEAISYVVSNILGLTFSKKSNMRENEFVEIIVKNVLRMLQAISNVERGQSSLRVDDNEMVEYVRRKQHIAREKVVEHHVMEGPSQGAKGTTKDWVLSTFGQHDKSRR